MSKQPILKRRLVRLAMLGLLAAFALVTPAEPAGDADASDNHAGRATTEIRDESAGTSTTVLAPDEERPFEGGADAGAALAAQPVLDTSLAATTAAMDPMEMIRVIVYLDYLPHEAVMDRVVARYATQIADIRAGMREIQDRNAALRRTDTQFDAENYSTDSGLTEDDRKALDALHVQNEAVGYAVMQETAAELQSLLTPYRLPVLDRINSLGGEVEFTTVVANTIVARLPAGNVPALARTPRVMRVTADQKIHSDLNLSDATTMVDPLDTTLTGLWDAGQDGGLYDPAVLDSGIDLTHPGMANSVGRTNYYSWFLTAGAGDPDYDDSADIEDRQGHGSHVAGIVASQGTGVYPNHLGMAFGVEQLVILKGAWLNSFTGGASIYWSDMYSLIDRVLYNTHQLQPFGTFTDDIDGLNLSYSGEITSDENDASRFIDSIVATYSDLVVTLSAGNSGPANAHFRSPASAYNAITVANAQDQGSADRVDDTIRPSSTRGPTASGRRKPDLAAHGSDINSANTFWETQLDYVARSGTSMAAPMVLGVAMDLMDAGVWDEKAIKALLINTAQKNEPGIDIESDSDGWDTAAGWGLMNAYAAYHHRSDIFVDSVTARGNPGSYHLYKGVMRDEGSAGEGRDRATMVWNRSATYATAAPPASYSSLSNLNMRLYRESAGSLIDTDFAYDNVHQVRVASGASDTDVVVKVYALDTSFDHGGATESFALATEEGFTEVDLPADFNAFANPPASVEPSEVFDYTFWLRNDSEIASHDNEFELILPAGWTLISGATFTDVGTIDGSGGVSTQVTYTLRAQAAPAAFANIDVRHRHTSYAEAYTGPFYRVSIPVEVDTVAPTPNPMYFVQLPDDTSISDIFMRSATASDLHGPVQYYFDYTSSPTGGGAANDSGWITSNQYTDALLSLNHQFCYRVRARDAAAVRNYTGYSGISCAYTAVYAPAGIGFGTVTTTSIDARSSSNVAGLTRGLSGLLIINQTRGSSSGWKQNNDFWTSTGLTPNTSYQFAARARNGDGDITAYSPSAVSITLANPPAAAAFSDITETSIRANINPNGNPAGTQFFIQNVTRGTSSGWLPSTSWNSTSLVCNTAYTFQAMARNGNGVVTSITPLGVQLTAPCSLDTDGDGVVDAADNCTLVANADQRDTNGDGFGNVCDPDLNNNGIVNAVDLGIFKTVFFTADPDADFDGNGFVNAVDLGILKLYFFLPPGPSGIAP